jgi:hypothetical protein
MKRREFIAGLGGAAAWPFARPLAAEAQRRVGFLSNGDNDPRTQSVGASKSSAQHCATGRQHDRIRAPYYSLGGKWLELF